MRAHSYTLKCILYYRLNRRRCCAYQLNYASLCVCSSRSRRVSKGAKSVGYIETGRRGEQAPSLIWLMGGIYEDLKEKRRRSLKEERIECFNQKKIDILIWFFLPSLLFFFFELKKIKIIRLESCRTRWTCLRPRQSLSFSPFFLALLFVIISARGEKERRRRKIGLNFHFF